jgi:hypothetical protein
MGTHNTEYPAQPDNLAVDRAAALLRTAANVLVAQAAVMQEQATRRRREDVRRILAGVVADVETVRYALKD